MDVNGMVGNLLPSFDAPTLQNLNFEGSGTEGVYQMRPSSRQFVKFSTETMFNAAKAQRLQAEGRPIAEANEKKIFVHIVTPGDRTEFFGLAEEYHKRIYARQFQLFKEGKGAIDGTPVESLEFVQAPEATELKHMGIHTGEQLAEAGDSAMDQIQRGHELREFARAWYKASHGTGLIKETKRIGADLSEAKETLAKQAKELEDTRKELLEMRAVFRKLQEEQAEQALLETETTKRIKK